MPKTKVAVTVESELLSELDALVEDGRYPNRSHAIEAAVAAELRRHRRTRLAEACSALDVAEERALADAGLGADAADWPEY